MPKRNPLNLNALQPKTLTLLQGLARLPDHGRPAQAPGAVIVTNLPQPHGDHFHVGDAVVATRDATGLANLAAWLALERKGLIKSNFPVAVVLTPEGPPYHTAPPPPLLHPPHPPQLPSL